MEASLQQLNEEHREILVCTSYVIFLHRGLTLSQNQLVAARMRNEELETELVRYKLLCVFSSRCGPALLTNIRYAEAMHQSEDAMSSHRISLLSSKRGSSGS